MKTMTNEVETIKFQSLTQASYLLRKKEDKSRVYILCHGFMSKAQWMWHRFIHLLPEDSTVLAVNAPFPIPKRVGEEWKVSYSWYFYDNFEDSFLVDYSICSDFLKNLIINLGLANNPKTIIGFSQGGYASPHVAQELKGVDHIVGIGCRFKVSKPRWNESLRIDGIHGEEDEVVDCSGAEESFLKIPEHHRGHFLKYQGVGHLPSEEMLLKVRDWIFERKKIKVLSRD